MAKKPSAAETLAAARAAKEAEEAAAAAAAAAAQAEADAQAAVEAEAAQAEATDDGAADDEGTITIVPPTLTGASTLPVPDDVVVGVFDVPPVEAPQVEININTEAASQEPAPVLSERTLAEMAAGRAALEARRQNG